MTFQRYKGLGEMNKDQLWETTLDRDARSLLQVKIREVDEADDIFVKLMGDVVEPRREFIQDNALSVANLDGVPLPAKRERVAGEARRARARAALADLLRQRVTSNRLASPGSSRQGAHTDSRRLDHKPIPG